MKNKRHKKYYRAFVDSNNKFAGFVSSETYEELKNKETEHNCKKYGNIFKL
jgi:hypothetical protein